MIIPLSLIGLFPDAQAQTTVTTVTATITGDPFTIGETGDTLAIGMYDSTPSEARDILIPRLQTHFSNTVDPMDQVLFLQSYRFLNELDFVLIDLDTTLGELQQTIDSTKQNRFRYNVTSLTDTNGNTDIYLVIARNSSHAATLVPLVENGDPQGQVTITDTSSRMFDSSFADSNIGIYINFNDNIRINIGERYPIIADFLLFQNDDTPINDITRTYNTVELSPAQSIIYQNLVNVITARDLAITQQYVIVDYWSNPLNPFVDDRELAQARIDYTNNHITQSIEQRDSYQAQLYQILN